MSDEPFRIFPKKCCVEYLRIGSTICEVCWQAQWCNFEHIFGFKVRAISLTLRSNEKCSYVDVISLKNGLNVLRVYLAPYGEI